MKLQNILALMLLLALIPLIECLPDEAMGRVTEVIDGDTVDIQIQEHDSRISEDLIRVRLADVDCPEVDAAGGRAAKEYASEWLQDKIVYLDLDDLKGMDPYDRWVAVVYIANPDGTINTSQNFNRILIDSGYACIWNFSDNEFSPASWWEGFLPSTACIKTDSSAATPIASGSITSVSTGFLGTNAGADSWQDPSSTPSQSSSYSDSSSGSFVGSIKSDKYHYPSCQWAEKIKPSNEIWFSSSQDARAQGYVPCKVCSPP